jgi:hypothetical protein
MSSFRIAKNIIHNTKLKQYLIKTITFIILCLYRLNLNNFNIFLNLLSIFKNALQRQRHYYFF